MVTSSKTTTHTAKEETIETDVLVIGGGVTGTGILRDLALRGLQALLIDRKDLCAGASGGNHGLLHSGSRYVSNDLHSAIECREESNILKRVASQCIEETGGLFVAVEGDAPEFTESFPDFCRPAGISCEPIAIAEARKIEPLLSEKIFKAYKVPDATIDPFRLALLNVAHARALKDSMYRPHTEVLRFTIENGKITEAICRDNRTHSLVTIRASQYVNASGAWAMNIA